MSKDICCETDLIIRAEIVIDATVVGVFRVALRIRERKATDRIRHAVPPVVCALTGNSVRVSRRGTDVVRSHRRIRGKDLLGNRCSTGSVPTGVGKQIGQSVTRGHVGVRCGGAGIQLNAIVRKGEKCFVSLDGTVNFTAELIPDVLWSLRECTWIAVKVLIIKPVICVQQSVAVELVD